MKYRGQPARSFRIKVAAGCAGAMVIAVLVGLVSLHVVREISRTAEHLASVHARDLIEVSELRVLTERMSEGARAYLVTRDEEERARIAASHGDFAEVVARLAERDAGAERPLLREVSAAEKSYVEAIGRVLQLKPGIGVDRALAAYHAEALPRLTELGRRIDNYVRVNERQLELERRDAKEAAATAQTLVASVVGGTLFAMLILGVAFAVSLDRMYRRTLEAEAAHVTRARQHAAVAGLANEALSTGELRQLMQRVASTAARVLELEHAMVLELEPDGRHLGLRAGVGWLAGQGPFEMSSDADSLAGYALRHHAVVLEDVRSEARFSIPALLDDHGVVSGVSVIVEGADRAYGVLGAFSREHREFSHGDVMFLQAAAHVLGAAIHARRVEKALRQALAARDEFLAVASHELRTPLTVLQLSLQRLCRGGGDLVVPYAVREKLRRLEAQVHRLGGLVLNLLDGARAAGGLDLHLEPVNLCELVGEVVERVRSDTGRAAPRIDVRCCDEVLGTWDRARVGQVVSNLVSNALKFGGGKPVSVAVGIRGASAHVEVRDQGIGIAPEFRERIFARFEQGVAPRSYGGLGLGLFLSRHIVEAHRGSIHVESEPGRGATFTVELPLDADPFDGRRVRGGALEVESVH